MAVTRSLRRALAAMLVAGAALLAAGCAKHDGILAPRITDPAVFDDGFGSEVDFQAFLGSKLDAIAIDSTTTHSGAVSLRITVPGPGDPSGGYAGGAFVAGRKRDLSGYDALSFWARADHAITFDVFGLGNDNTGTSRFEAKRSAIPLTTTWTRVVIPLPLASRLADEKGLFFFAEGPEAGLGATVWLDEVVFTTLGTITNPRPTIPTVSIAPDVGADVPVTGTQVTFAVDGVDATLDVMPGYFTFLSSDPSVATGGEGTLRAVGLGSAQVTATLGAIPAAGVITLNPNPAPLVAAPAPTLPAGDVLSLFSNAYTNLPVDTWSTTWDQADVSDVKVAGDDAKKYRNLVFSATEFTGANVVNATAMTHFHADVWAAGRTLLKIKLVDFGANGVFGGADDREHELTFNAGSTPPLVVRGWTSLDIPFTSFTNLTTRGHLAQLILSGDVGTVYVDNVYFHR